jgi:FixJ family two-component response regulator
VRVLYMSGHSESSVLFAGTPGAAFLEKPFVPATLISAVRSVLDMTPFDRADG